MATGGLSHRLSAGGDATGSLYRTVGQGAAQGQGSRRFCYLDKGNLAVISRHAAVADMGFMRVWNFPAWLIGLFVHIAHLIEFDNKVMVLFQWAWNYFTRKRGARLITGRDA